MIRVLVGLVLLGCHEHHVVPYGDARSDARVRDAAVDGPSDASPDAVRVDARGVDASRDVGIDGRVFCDRDWRDEHVMDRGDIRDIDVQIALGGDVRLATASPDDGLHVATRRADGSWDVELLDARRQYQVEMSPTDDFVVGLGLARLEDSDDTSRIHELSRFDDSGRTSVSMFPANDPKLALSSTESGHVLAYRRNGVQIGWCEEARGWACEEVAHDWLPPHRDATSQPIALQDGTRAFAFVDLDINVVWDERIHSTRVPLAGRYPQEFARLVREGTTPVTYTARSEPACSLLRVVLPRLGADLVVDEISAVCPVQVVATSDIGPNIFAVEEDGTAYYIYPRGGWQLQELELVAPLLRVYSASASADGWVAMAYATNDVMAEVRVLISPPCEP